MKLSRRAVLATLVVAVAAGATFGLAYALATREFNLSITGTVTVQMVSQAQAADVNGDGVVDGADLRIVASNLGTSPPGDERADIDGNGVVDVLDLALVALYFGQTPNPTPTPTPIPAPPPPVQSDILSFSLENHTIPAGTTVVWTNQSGSFHTTTSGVPGAQTGIWDSGFLSGGGQFQFTFDTPGTFPYYCTLHPSSMQATITVQ